MCGWAGRAVGGVTGGEFVPTWSSADFVPNWSGGMGPVRPDPHRAVTPGMTVVQGNYIFRTVSHLPGFGRSTPRHGAFSCARCNNGPFCGSRRLISCPVCGWAGREAGGGTGEDLPTWNHWEGVEPPTWWETPTGRNWIMEDARVRESWRRIRLLHGGQAEMEEVD